MLTSRKQNINIIQTNHKLMVIWAAKYVLLCEISSWNKWTFPYYFNMWNTTIGMSAGAYNLFLCTFRPPQNHWMFILYFSSENLLWISFSPKNFIFIWIVNRNGAEGTSFGSDQNQSLFSLSVCVCVFVCSLIDRQMIGSCFLPPWNIKQVMQL